MQQGSRWWLAVFNGLFVAFSAVAVAFSEGFLHASPVAGQWRGDAMGLAAGMFWGLTTIAIRSTEIATVAVEKRAPRTSGGHPHHAGDVLVLGGVAQRVGPQRISTRCSPSASSRLPDTPWGASGWH
jgi:hypothetical protein